MKKNGFTLVELLIVIVMLSIIALLIVPIMNRQIKQNREKMLTVQIKNIEAVAKTWAGSNMKWLPTIEGETLVITISHLKASGLLEKEVKNPITGNYFDNQMKINIEMKNKGLQYQVGTILETENITDIDLDQPTISLKGNALLQIQKGQPFVEPGVIAFTPDMSPVTTIDQTIMRQNTIATTIDTNQLGTYEITYTAVNGLKIDRIKRTVEVVE